MIGRILKSRWFWIGGLVTLGLVGLLIWSVTTTGGTDDQAVMPSPNGYDDFVAAEKDLTGGLPDLTKAPPEELRRSLTEHASALKRAREGLNRECRLRLDYSPSGRTNFFTGLAESKTLGLLLRAEGRLAESEGDYSKAFRCYLDGIQFTAKRFHGGLVIHKLIAIALAGAGQAQLTQLIPKVPTEDVQLGLRILKEIDHHEEPVEVISERDFRWGRKTSNTSVITGMIYRIMPQFRKTRTSYESKLQAAATERRRVLIALAARLFELDTGRRATGFGDLVPKYLPDPPKDAVSGKTMDFR